MCPNRACDNVGSKYDIVEERLLQALAQWLEDYRLEWSDRPPSEEQALMELKAKSIRKAQSEVETLQRQLERTHDLLEQGVYDTEMFLTRSPVYHRAHQRRPREHRLPHFRAGRGGGPRCLPSEHRPQGRKAAGSLLRAPLCAGKE